MSAKIKCIIRLKISLYGSTNLLGTYDFAGRCSRFPLSRQVAHAACITDKPEPCVAPKLNICPIFCAVCS